MDALDVQKVASLARLAISEGEQADYRRQLTAILDYVALLDEVNIEGVEPMPHAIDVRNVFRPDECRESLPRTDALSNAPASDGSFFLVPRILEEKK
ncbi:MAG: Asp-tRNA(Asn)/Glu-tRNA(Gln) amidotransferase subunit GatC [Planctomyces sp.]|nr:Asp-tRNA(Asn)/Glu-tRNA(Gln) amidotransferase subunit GatC [Planctomyces sp.]